MALKFCLPYLYCMYCSYMYFFRKVRKFPRQENANTLLFIMDRAGRSDVIKRHFSQNHSASVAYIPELPSFHNALANFFEYVFMTVYSNVLHYCSICCFYNTICYYVIFFSINSFSCRWRSNYSIFVHGGRSKGGVLMSVTLELYENWRFWSP